MTHIKRFFKDESGATAIEYGLLVALISLAGLAAMQLIAPELLGIFTDAQNAVTAGNALN